MQSKFAKEAEASQSQKDLQPKLSQLFSIQASKRSSSSLYLMTSS